MADRRKFTFSLSEPEATVLDKIHAETGLPYSAIIADTVREHLADRLVKDERLRVADGHHLGAIAPTLFGKTRYLLKRRLIPLLETRRRIVVLDVRGEYGREEKFEQIPLQYTRTIPYVADRESAQTFMLGHYSAIAGDTASLVNSAIDRIAKSKSRRVSVGLEFADPTALAMVVTDLLKRIIMRRKRRPGIALVVEDASLYDQRALAYFTANAKNAGIQAVLVTQSIFCEEIMGNLKPILGPIDPRNSWLEARMNESTRPVLAQLPEGQFLHEPKAGRGWRRDNCKA